MQSPRDAKNAVYLVYDHNDITLAVYTCKDGYMWTDETRIRSIICVNGQWSTQVSHCIREYNFQ